MSIATVFRRLIPFSPSTTLLQGVTYLLGISLFSISFLVFLNSSVSFVVTDLIGQKKGVGNVVGTLGFVDELVVLVACPAWGLASDRLGVRWVAVLGYLIIGVALMVFVQARHVYPDLVLARILFAVGASAAATMVTAILPSLTDENEEQATDETARSKSPRNSRHSMAFSVESELTITPERYTRTVSSDQIPRVNTEEATQSSKSSHLAGYVGLFTGAGALLALGAFLPLPAWFGEKPGVTPAEAVKDSFYVVGAVALVVAVLVFVGLRGIKGEEGKGWRMLLGMRAGDENGEDIAGPSRGESSRRPKVVPYAHLLKDSVLLAFADHRIALGYLGGFVARASTVAISLFIPLFVNTFFINNGFCQGSPHDSSPELKKECRAAYLLSSALTGVAQTAALCCAPVFGYLSHRSSKGLNIPIVVSTVFGMVGYVILPQLSSPEFKNENGRGGTPWIFLVVCLIGISQIGAIVCSLGSLSRGILAAELNRPALQEPSLAPGEDESTEADPLIRISTERNHVSRVQLKGSIAGVYSLCGGAAILLLTKLGGLLFDKVTTGAPFYMMAAFNAMLLVASLGIDASQTYARNQG